MNSQPPVGAIPPLEWENVSTSLVITPTGNSPQHAAQLIFSNLEFSESVQAGVTAVTTDRSASLTFGEKFSPDAEEQVLGLSRHLASKAAIIREFAHQGNLVGIEISGLVETNAKLRLSPAAFAAISTLGASLTFRTLVPEELQEDDPLAWLD
ncbi:hypothetical protein [Streptomyces sioyaensis]|uniref:hypothetical protein n=1 Tax=Streptomyces sioyaensis TaxID=67364 RepID=UPI003D73F9A3